MVDVCEGWRRVFETDHGTATVALLAGGALKGRRVIADWPGLKDAELFEGRDLKPTTDLRAVLKGVLKDHLRLDEEALASLVFPGSRLAKPMPGLVASDDATARPSFEGRVAPGRRGTIPRLPPRRLGANPSGCSSAGSRRA